jgi:hypothetical protein
MFFGGGPDDVELEEPDDKQLVSPLLLAFGWDIDLNLGDGWIARIPFEFGFALNSKLSDDYYDDSTYKGSSSVSFKAGFAMAYKL